MSRQRIATALLLTRGAGRDVEAFCVLRAPELRFFGGYWASPGGVQDPADVEGDDDEERGLVRCGLRELFEETGVLPAAARGALDAAARSDLRARLLERDAEVSGPAAREFRALLDSHPAALAEARTIGTLTTPPFAPVRYRTRFLHLELPDTEEPTVLPGELTDGRFARPRDWIAAWRAGDERIAPPVLFLLELLDDHGADGFLEAAAREVAALEAGRLHPIRNVPGIVMAPLASATLPPATTTNAYVVGEERLFVVDPAPDDPTELERLFEMLDRRVAAGSRVEGVLLTHQHPDHVGGAVRTAREYDAPVLAHPETLARVDLEDVERRPLRDGQRLHLGAGPDGRPRWSLEALHTPGHAPGHLCFVDSLFNALLAGDLVSTVSTIVIDPDDDGHLATYLASLGRLIARGVGVLHPAHGPVATDGVATLRGFVEHRGTRERLLVGVLGDEPRSLDQLLDVVYADVTDDRLRPIARRSLRAGLIKLVEERRAREESGGWVLGGA